MTNKTIILALLLCAATAAFSQSKNKIWFNEPAEVFEEAFPLGNGRVGAMLYGKTDTERISLNEATLWAGMPVDPNMNPEAKNYLPALMGLLNDPELYRCGVAYAAVTDIPLLFDSGMAVLSDLPPDYKTYCVPVLVGDL